MKILRSITLIVLVLVLAACGASVEVPETVTDTAELELQILTSLPDSESIDRLEVLSEDGEVLYFVTGFVNRFHTLTLEMGKTYRIAAQADVYGQATHRAGLVSFATEVTLVSANQHIALDLRQAYTSNVYVESDGRLSVSLSLHKHLYGSYATELAFVGGSYGSDAYIPIDAVSLIIGGGGSVEWNGNLITITPEVFGEEGFDFALLLIQYASVPPLSCVTSMGVFNFSWENGPTKLDQELEVFIPCKG
ncbi:MAG: hypothetical protein WDZ74_00770 [Candidatus Paceibacterota bacterium]